MVQRFGALALAAAMNARQVTTIFLSYLTQTQPLTWVQRVSLSHSEQRYQHQPNGNPCFNFVVLFFGPRTELGPKRDGLSGTSQVFSTVVRV